MALRLSYLAPDMFDGGISEWPFGRLEPAKYGCIAVDPPWRFEAWSEKGEGRSPGYDLMSVEAIKALPVADLAAKDCALFMWVVNPMLAQAFDVMRAWGFTYKTVAFCWAKTTAPVLDGVKTKYHMGLGYWSRSNVELCLLGVRGKPQRVARDVRQLIVSPRQEHSRKPVEFYSSVQRLVGGPYADLFSRESRPGWSAWGNEAGKFDAKSMEEVDSGSVHKDGFPV